MQSNKLVLSFPALSEKRPALHAERQIRLSDLTNLANKQIQMSYHGSNPLWSLHSVDITHLQKMLLNPYITLQVQLFSK